MRTKVVTRLFGPSFILGRAIFVFGGVLMIELKNISKVFHTADGDVDACSNVDIKVESGEIFGIIGFSGAGKSTLIR